MDIGKKTAPLRPPLPTKQSIEAYQKKQVKTRLGQSQHTIRKTTNQEIESLSVNPKKSIVKDKLNQIGKNIKERAVTKYQAGKSQSNQKLATYKEKLSHLNEARKAWQTNPKDQTVELGKIGLEKAQESLKQKATKVKSQTVAVTGKIKDLGGRAKDAYDVWKHDKKNVSLSVAISTSASVKKNAISVGKKIQNYTVTKFKNMKTFITSPVKAMQLKLVQKKLNERQCSIVEAPKTNAKKAPSRPDLPDFLK